MLKSLIFLFRFFVFWLLFFFLDRLIFILIYLKAVPNRSFLETLGAFFYGLRLDLATVCYVGIPVFVWFAVQMLSGKQDFRFRWLNIYDLTVISLVSVISMVNINIYREWGSKVNAKAIGFAFSSPNEAFASSASSPVLMNIMVVAFLIVCGSYLSKRLIMDGFSVHVLPFWKRAVFTAGVLSMAFLFIRGGLGVSPNNQSMAYYSQKQVLNHAAVNTYWNLIADLLKSRHADDNPYAYFGEQEARAVVNHLQQPVKDTTIHMLTVSRPNVVLIIMESFTADLTQALGNETGITPGFDSLIKQGVLFSRIYSTGNRTDKGVVGTLSGEPGLSKESLMKWPGKMERIPSVAVDLLKNNYKTLFFYGGQSEFDNYKAYVLSHSYQTLIDKSKFGAHEMNSKWGAYDGVVFNRQLQELNQTAEPFFSTQLTLTNHEPFEVPGHSRFGDSDNIQKFKSTAFYTDSCLQDFLQQAKTQTWYKNTLFIFVADHGHIMPKNRAAIYIPQRYHIPLLFYGDVIKKEFRGKVMTKTGSQADVAATLLHQLNIDARAYVWSKNLMNPYTKPFAFFSWDDGMGFIDNKHCVTFDNVGKNILYNDEPENIEDSNTLLNYSKAYLQTAYQRFLRL